MSSRLPRLVPLLAGVPLAATLSVVGARPAAAQASAVAASRAVEGDVVQAESGAPLGGATVVLLPEVPGALAAADPGGGSAFLSGARRVVTDATGRYRFAGVVPGAYVLRVARLGFRPATVEVELRAPQAEGGAAGGAPEGVSAARVSVGLTVVPIRLRPVAVAGESVAPYARYARTSARVADARSAAFRARQSRFLTTDAREVTHADVEEAVTLGETDLFRALQRLPGVATQGDVSAQLWTRGARWDQTRVTWDGLPLFNPVHTGGALSAVSTDAIGAAFLLPGVRPASVGDGSAAVLDLRSRPGGSGDGRPGAVRGAGELSLISARAALDGSVAGGRGGWMISARRSYWDLASAHLSGDSSAFPYHLGEVAGRADWRFGGGRALEVSALRSRDQMGGGASSAGLQSEGASWGNAVARATLTTPARLGALGTVALRQTLGVSHYAGDAVYAPVQFVLPSRTFATDVAGGRRPVRARVDYVALSGEVAPADAGSDAGAPAWTGGYALTAQRTVVRGALAGVYGLDAADSTVVDRRGTLPVLALWGERRVRPARALTVAAGLRAEAGTPVRGDGPLRLAPRVTARYAFGEGGTTLSAGAGRHYQYLQGVPGTLLTAQGAQEGGLLRPIPLWIAADGATPALRTDLATAGVERWTGAGWDWTLNAYVRRTAGLAVVDERPGSATGRPLFVVGREDGRGVEFGVRRVVGRWTGGANYAVGAAATTAYGARFASPEDRRRVFNATAGLRVGGGGRFGAAFTSLSGAPYTPYAVVMTPADSAGAGGTSRLAYGAPSSARFPAFRRLDLLAEWTWAVRRARFGGYLQVVNALGRDNPLGVPGLAIVCPPATGAGPPCAAEPARPKGGFITVPLVGLRASF